MSCSKTGFYSSDTMSSSASSAVSAADSTPPAAPWAGEPGGLHPRLAADCHLLGRLERASVLLHRNARIAWLILVPDTDARGWHELDDAEHDRISGQVRDLSITAGDYFKADKMNVASIGNEVPQMHIHVVARHENDACWPKPVWGHLPAGPDYSAERVTAITHMLALALNMKAAAGT